MFERFRRKKNKQQVVMPAAKITDVAPTIPLENRMADLKDTGADDIIAHLNRIGVANTGGDLTRSYNIQETEPAQFKQMIADEFGGGPCELYFTRGDRVIMLDSDPTKREVHHFRIAGPSKKTKAEKEAVKLKKPEITTLAEILSDKEHPLAPLLTLAADLLRNAVTGGNSNSQAGFDQVVDSVMKVRQLIGEPQPPQNPMAVLDGALGVVEKVRAHLGVGGLANPISPTGALAGGGWRTTVGELAGAAAATYDRQSGGQISRMLGLPIQTPGAQAQPGQMPMTQQPAANVRPDTSHRLALPGLGEMDPAEYIISQAERRADPDEIARAAVYALDFMSNMSAPGSEAMKYAQLWITDPSGSFKTNIADRPEFEQIQQADPAYVGKLKAALFQAGKNYIMEYNRAAAQQAADQVAAATEQAEPEPVQHTEEPADTWEGAEDASIEETADPQPAEPGEGDGQPGTPEGDDHPDRVREEC